MGAPLGSDDQSEAEAECASVGLAAAGAAAGAAAFARAPVEQRILSSTPSLLISARVELRSKGS